MSEDVPKSLKKSFNASTTAVKNTQLTPPETCTWEKNITKLPKRKETGKQETLSRNVVLKTTMKLCLSWVFWLNNSKSNCKVNFFCKRRLQILSSQMAKFEKEEKRIYEIVTKVANGCVLILIYENSTYWHLLAKF